MYGESLDIDLRSFSTAARACALLLCTQISGFYYYKIADPTDVEPVRPVVVVTFELLQK